MTVLVVEDDQGIASLIRLYLEKEHYKVTIASNGNEGIQLFSRINPDIVLLDLMLPEKDGWTVIKGIRENSNVPIIVLTAKSEEIDKVLGLESGADDYMTKPFSPRELVARIKAVMRRSHALTNSLHNSAFQIKDLLIDPLKIEVQKSGKHIRFSALEFKLLNFLASHPGYVYSRNQLIDIIYAEQDVFVEERTIDVHIKNIRKKLNDPPKNPHYIESIFGVGYRFIET